MVIAAMLAALLCIIYYCFRNDSLIGDGLRHLPAMRSIVPGTPPTFQAKPWLEIYREHYDDFVVHNHFLFGLAMRGAFALQQAIGSRGDALVAMQVTNALSGAIAGALVFLLGLRVGLSRWLSAVITLGLCLSPVYLLAATNIAETALALPFFVGTLLLLTRHGFSGWTPLAAGVVAGLCAIFYFLDGALVPGIVVALLATQFPLRAAVKPVLLFLGSFALVFMGIWVGVLAASGYGTGPLVRAILMLPQQGTYGGFKLGSLIATPIGLTEGFFPILPDGFIGLRSLFREGPGAVLYAGVATLIVCAFLGAVFYVLYRQGALRSRLAITCILSFLLIEGACVEWDAYYQKLHLFAVVLCLTMAMVALSKREPLDIRWPVLLFLGLTMASGVGVLRRNVQPSQMRANAQQLAAIIGNGELITTWSGDVMHMVLYPNAGEIVSLPDLAMALQLDSKRVQHDLDTIIQQATAQGRSVYIYGLFEEKSGKASGIYETRFRLAGITEYLSGLRLKSKPVARLPQPAGQSIMLYEYVP